MDRCHLIGQAQLVHVYRLATSNYVEGRIIKRAFRKLKLEHVMIGKGQFQQDVCVCEREKEREMDGKRRGTMCRVFVVDAVTPLRSCSWTMWPITLPCAPFQLVSSSGPAF